MRRFGSRKMPMIIFDGKGEREFLHRLLPHIEAAGRLQDLRVIDPTHPAESARRPGARRRRPVHAAAQRRWRRGRNERQRHPLPGPGRGGRRAGAPAPLHGGDGGRGAHVDYAVGAAPGWATAAWTWDRRGSARTSPRSSTTGGSAPSTSATRTSCCSGPTRARSTSPSWVPSSRRPSTVASTSNGSRSCTTTRAISSSSASGERGVGETLACGTGSVAAAAAARSWGTLDGAAPIRVRNPGGTLEVTLGADGETTLPCRSRAQGGRRGHPSRNALLSNLLPGTLIERTFRERIVLVGVVFPGLTAEMVDERARRARPAGRHAPGPTWSAAWCSAVTPRTRPPSSAGQGRGDRRAQPERRRRHRRLRRRAVARPSSATSRSSSDAPRSTAPR